MTKNQWIRKIIKIGPAAIISIVVIVLFFAIVYTRYGGQLIFTDGSITIPFFAMLVLCAATFIYKFKTVTSGTIRERAKVFGSIRNTIVEWLPFPLLLFVYENLKGRINVITDHNYTEFLMKFDYNLFGFQPTIVLQNIITPWLTNVMAICYASYFIIPFICVFLLYLQKRKDDFHIATTSIIICFYLGYIGYISFPAVIPKFYFRDVYEVSLSGGSGLHRFMDRMYEKANAAEIWGAFPSLHIAVSSLGLLLCYYFKGLVGKGRLLFWLMLPLVLGLWFSTVYLRYHWTIDIFTGWLLAPVSFLIGKWIVNRWSRFVKFETTDSKPIDLAKEKSKKNSSVESSLEIPDFAQVSTKKIGRQK